MGRNSWAMQALVLLPGCTGVRKAKACLLHVELGSQESLLHFSTPKGPVSVSKDGGMMQIRFPAAKATADLPADLQLSGLNLKARF